MATIELVLISFYLVLPAYFANMAPVIFDKLGWLKGLAKPIDGGRKIKQEFIFGLGKTWRGIAAAVILAIIISFVQAVLFRFDFFRNISLVDYPRDFLWFGFLAGLGAILGDLIKSFFKRRFNISSGRSWPIFDQLDFMVGFLLFTFWLVRPSIDVVVTVLILTLILHPLTNLSAYFMKIKKVWW